MNNRGAEWWKRIINQLNYCHFCIVSLSVGYAKKACIPTIPFTISYSQGTTKFGYKMRLLKKIKFHLNIALIRSKITHLCIVYPTTLWHHPQMSLAFSINTCKLHDIKIILLINSSLNFVNVNVNQCTSSRQC